MLDAIRSLGLRVTAADVAATTGLPLNATIRELNGIASDTSAILQVSENGTIAYLFKIDPEIAFRAKGLRKAALIILEKVKNAALWMVRCSFGILLIGSILTLLVIFAVAVAFAMTAADGADGDLDIMGGDIDALDGDLDFNFFDLVNLTMFFTWWHRDVTEIDYYGHKLQTRETGFVSNCFSFLFGDGDPNRNFEETAWKNIADIIRLHNGVITAEQVGPYLKDLGSDNSIFPVLVRFDGTPEVTNTGHIVYQFPSLQQTAAGHVFNPVPMYAQEEQWKFSKIPAKRLDLVFYFAGANLAGWYAVAGNLSRLEFLMPWKWLIELLLTYALFFIAFPMVRSICNSVRNAWIEVCNNQRKRNAELLTKATLQAKIQEAQQFALAMQWHDPNQLAYTTEKDVLDQDPEFDPLGITADLARGEASPSHLLP